MPEETEEVIETVRELPEVVDPADAFICESCE